MATKDVNTLMNYRKDVRVLDVTMRDGGIVNDFYFNDDFVKALYKTNIEAGVDMMEMGYKASRRMFDETKFGKWKFCRDEDIIAAIGPDKDPSLRIAVMADAGRTDYKTDIINKADSYIDYVRVATYVHQMPTAIAMIEDAKAKGYDVGCNLMAVSTAKEDQIRAALQLLGESPIDVIYVVDSYGSLYPEEIARMVDMYQEYADRYGKKLGVHAHNNQQLAFANTIEAVGDGVSWLDASYNGMGRGAGNCSMENLLGFLRNPKYDVYPAIQFVENYMLPLKAKGPSWGYDLPYMMTGLLNQHPRAAIAFGKAGRTDYSNFFHEVTLMD